MTVDEILATLPSPLRQDEGAATAYAHGLADLVMACAPSSRPPKAVVRLWAAGATPLADLARQLQRPARDEVVAQAVAEVLG